MIADTLPCNACGTMFKHHDSVQKMCKNELEARKHVVKLLRLITATRDKNLMKSSIYIAANKYMDQR